jgi:hypothetical protein
MTVRQPTAILIVGMHRSGTSALAGLVGKLGVPLGDHLLEPGSDNPKGYWEHQDVVMVHERLLRALGSRWDDVRALPVDWQDSEVAQEASLAIDKIITRDFSDNLVWAVKDPRLCRVLPLWIETLQKKHIRPVILFMVRKPNEVSASIEARNNWQPLVGQLLWLRYMTEAITASSTLAREVVLYDDLLVNPIRSVATAFAKLGLEIGDGTSTEQRKAIAGFVDVSDRHHVDADPADTLSRIGVIAAKLYESFVAIAHGANRWNAADRIVQDFHREWSGSGDCIDAVADMAAKLELRLQASDIENIRISSALTAQVRWSEEAQAKCELLQTENSALSSTTSEQSRLMEEAQGKYGALHIENAELSSKLSAQIRWSEGAQARQEALQAEKADLSSKLRAQLSWSEEAQRKYEALHIENAELSSKLKAQIRWSEEAQARQGALQAEKADLSSKLRAQLSWSEEAQRKYEALHIENAELSSKLKAQIRWSEEAQARQEALQAEKADLSSKLRAQLSWSEEAQTRCELLQAEVADLSSKLTAQFRWSEEAQAKHDALQTEYAGLSSKLMEKIAHSDEARSKYELLAAEHADLTAQQLNYANKCERLERDLEEAWKDVRDLSTQLERSENEASQTSARLTLELHDAIGERGRLADELEQTRAARLAMATDLQRVYASTSWRMTKPLRSVSELFKRESGPVSSSARKPK